MSEVNPPVRKWPKWCPPVRWRGLPHKKINIKNVTKMVIVMPFMDVDALGRLDDYLDVTEEQPE